MSEPFGAQFTLEARMFGFTEEIAGRGPFWGNILQLHDTHGVPFDLLWLSLRENNRTPLTAEQFSEHMQMVRYDLATYGSAVPVITYE